MGAVGLLALSQVVLGRGLGRCFARARAAGRLPVLVVLCVVFAASQVSYTLMRPTQSRTTCARTFGAWRRAVCQAIGAPQ